MKRFLFLVLLFLAFFVHGVYAQNSCVLGDTDGDGKVTFTDFEVWRRAFMGNTQATITASPPIATMTQAPNAPGGIIPDPLYGVTIDSVDNLSDIVTSLSKLVHKPTTRIVFDENVPATQYQSAVDQIHPVSYIMGEILDSYYVKNYSVQSYLDRTTEYLNAFGDKVDIWEIGNEINGEWLGNNGDVVSKMTGAYNIVKQRGKRTELTLYYNQGCFSNASNEMFTWTDKNIPAEMKAGLDYVLISYYEDDCNGLQPDWQQVFDKMHAMFPNSRIGMGEVGTQTASKKAEYITRYYTMHIQTPSYVGGYFWWYFKQDGIPFTKPNWSVLNNAIK